MSRNAFPKIERGTMTKNEILAIALGNIETLREYAEEALTKHSLEYGEDIPRYKSAANQIREDISAAKDCERLVRTSIGLPDQ